MRTLLLLRGAPGCGKSTWIKENGLEDYSLSADEVRMLYSSPKLKANGEYEISQEEDTVVWENIMKILEYRMEKGEFTVIDATNSKTKDMQKYKQLCDAYRYRIYCVDFTDIPIEIAKERNKQRPQIKWVPDYAIENIYSRFETQKIPSGIEVIKRDELWKIMQQPIDLSAYEKVIHIGDIHGCYTTLMKYFEDNPYNENYCYIFHGDYIDRGNENYEVLNFLDSIKDRKNVCLLEGNHERSLYLYGNDIQSYSKEFEFRTKPELIKNGFNERKARMLYRKVRQCSYYKYGDKIVMSCHGGIPNLIKNILFVPTKNLIKGVGTYDEYRDIADSWMGQTDNNCYLVHGHRNTNGDEIRIADRVFNLEGGIEFGGKLRIVELDKNGWKEIEIENCQPVKEDDLSVPEKKPTSIEEMIVQLRNNKFVNEKKLGDGISSFNFSREAFYRGNWNKQTVLARGLFVDTENKEIQARSYEKFFNINERPQTELSMLKMKFEFPIKMYLKENGFLATVSYNKNNDELFITSKSTNKGDYVGYIKEVFKDENGKVKEWLKEHKNYTMVFECIHIEKDPHIIEYKNNRFVLLDIIENSLEFNKIPYDEMCNIAIELGLAYKELYTVCNDWEEFTKYYAALTTDDTWQYEGVVIEDANGFMVKLKSAYYNQWKKMRTVAESTMKCGYIRKTSMLTTSLENKFYGFCRNLYSNGYNGKTDIITLRKMFLSQ